MVNTFQANCHRQVKRVTYIGFLDTRGNVIVEEKYSDAPDEPFGTDTVDQKVLGYLCIQLSDPVR